MFRLTYSSAQAAEFLGITVLQLDALAKRGHIQMQSYKKREFYLGGELDAAKPNVRNLVSQLPQVLQLPSKRLCYRPVIPIQAK